MQPRGSAGHLGWLSFNTCQSVSLHLGTRILRQANGWTSEINETLLKCEHLPAAFN